MSSPLSSREILSRALSLRPLRLDGPVPPRGSDHALDRALEPKPKPEIKEKDGDSSWQTSTLRKIGFGQCGLVFTVPDQPGMVVKIARPHFGESLYADFMAHQKVEETLGRRSEDEPARNEVQVQVQLPGVFYFLAHPNTSSSSSSTNASVIGGDAPGGMTVLLAEKFQPGSQGEFTVPLSPKDRWDTHLPLFPLLYSTRFSTGPSSSQGLGQGQDASASQYSKFQLPAEALFTEHIPPLAEPIREALIELYCPPEAGKQASVRADPANRDCLLRVYLGRRRAVDEKTGLSRLVTNFALRNYNLHLDQMLELGLDVHLLARVMGRTLADVHWAAGVDAFDVEFVLGGARRTTTGKKGGMEERVADMWLLDFNLCSRFEVEQLVGETERLDGLVEHLVYAFFANDPYYPRPWTNEDKEKGCEEGDILLWGAFAQAYVDRADGILRSRKGEMYGALKDLPVKFIRGCVEKQKTLSPGVDKIGVD